jgi:cysteine desulfurase
MAVNNETGIRNNIKEIGSICKERNVPFHTDMVQMFGKYQFNPADYFVDAFSASFHKLNGPPGVGILVMRNSLIKGYNIKPIIYGTQNYGLRGGTENVPSVAGSFMAYNMSINRNVNKLIELKKLIMTTLAKSVPTTFIDDYNPDHNKKIAIVWLCPKNINLVVPWTLFIAVDKEGVCNVKLKEKLEKNKIIISIGSACNTSSKNASHVVKALNIPQRLKPGILRISLGHDNTPEECIYFCKVLLTLIGAN